MDRVSFGITLSNCSIWLGDRWTWEDFEDKEDGVRHPHLDDLYMSLPLTGLLILFKTLIQRFIFLPAGVWYGMENRSIGPCHDPSTKKIFDDSKTLYGKKPILDPYVCSAALFVNDLVCAVLPSAEVFMTHSCFFGSMWHSYSYSMWETFWNWSIWLGDRWTWEDFEDKEDGVRHPHLDDLYMSLPLTGLLILFKTLIQRFIFLPVGVWYGMENRTIGISHDPSTEKLLDDSMTLYREQDLGHANDANGNLVQIKNRFRQPRSSIPLNILDKFTNSGWKFVYKSVCLAFEVYYLWNKEWLWNIELCWHGYPHQDVDNSLKWFYCFQLAFFMTEMVLQINEPIGKDLLIMAIHHVCAVNMVGMSWVTNQVRIVALGMLAHDIGDVVLQFGKMLLQTKYFVVAKYYLIPMSIAWISARNVFYFNILSACNVYFDELGLWGAYYVGFGFGCILFCLDVIWTTGLLRLILRMVTTGRVENSRHVD